MKTYRNNYIPGSVYKLDRRARISSGGIACVDGGRRERGRVCRSGSAGDCHCIIPSLEKAL